MARVPIRLTAMVGALVVPSLPAAVAAQGGSPWSRAGVQGDAVLRDFRFASGERLDTVRIHYTTLGTPRKDARGTVRNAVMILHGTGGTGRGFLSASYAGELFGPGQLLDSARYYIILPDNLGHGGSSKPSDGLRMRFPSYGYADMVAAQHRLLTEHLGVNHLRLIMGTSMGCMHSWVWGYTHPTFMDGLAPMACVPAQIAGRNRMIRTMAMDAIKADPAWQGGNYTTTPVQGLRASQMMLYIMSSAPLVQQAQAPTRDAADSVIRTWLDARVRSTDANDFLYYFNASSDYDPAPHLEKISAPALFINSADDAVNPPELGMAEALTRRMPKTQFILLPITAETRGHGTHSLPKIWGQQLGRFLSTLPER
jgi:homoserine O-acetyltransferase